MKKSIFLALSLFLPLQTLTCCTTHTDCDDPIPTLIQAKKNIEKIDHRMVQTLVQNNPQVCHELVECALEKINTVPRKTLKVLIKHASKHDKTKLEKLLQKKLSKDICKAKTFFAAFIKKTNASYLKKKFPHIFGAFKTLTQSGWHLKKYKRQVKNNHKYYLDNHNEAKKMTLDIQKKELEEQQKGNYTFVHGQQWKWHFEEDIFRHLWELRYSEPVKDFRFLRFEPKLKNLKNEINKREKALNGSDDYTRSKGTENNAKADRLFMNQAIFGNTNALGESSFNYWFDNYDCSCGEKCYDIKKLFLALDIKPYYHKYKKRFKNLEKLHRQAENHGNLLLISCTPEQVEKAVVMTKYVGCRMPTFINDKKTFKTKKVLDALKKNGNNIEIEYTHNGHHWKKAGEKYQSDQIEYCLLLTHDIALDPHNGPRIYSFNTPREKEFKKYEKLRDEIFSELAQDIAADVQADPSVNNLDELIKKKNKRLITKLHKTTKYCSKKMKNVYKNIKNLPNKVQNFLDNITDNIPYETLDTIERIVTHTVVPITASAIIFMGLYALDKKFKFI